MKTLTRYRLLKPIVLGFIDSGEQCDVIVKPRDGVTLESDGNTIWLINEKGRHESTTMPTLLDVCADRFEKMPNQEDVK